MLALNETTTGLATITELGQLFGLSARAIRFYEERGLVEARRDRLNRRRYDRRARTRLQVIAQFRRAGLALDDIEEILTLQDRAEGSDHVARAMEKLNTRLAAIEQEKNEVEAVMAILAQTAPKAAA
ncbi:MAG: MerR family transcriptional regulator [Phenylobacterium sp.]|uniref:MerR family transcriptional regulator n=1 Tax=Phenylobacterium sp. TaxID=1871053 RepID=UPI003918AA58